MEKIYIYSNYILLKWGYTVFIERNIQYYNDVNSISIKIN